MPSEIPKSTRPPGKRWAAIKRTQQKMAPPPGGEDTGALLAKSMEAFWAAREKTAANEIDEMPTLFLRAAALLRGSFWSDFWFALIPTALVLLTYLVLWRAGVVPPVWLPSVATVLALLVFAGAWWWRRSIPSLRYSIGALAAGLLVSIGVGVYLYQQNKVNNSMALFAMRGEVENIAISSLRLRLEERKEWPTPQIEGAVLSLQSKTIGEGVVYTASAHSFPGELVASIGPTSGEVRWVSTNQDSLQTTLAAGRLISTTQQGDWKFAASAFSNALDLWADPKFVIKPKAGDCLIVVFQPSKPRNKVERAVRLDSCRSLEEAGAAN